MSTTTSFANLRIYIEQKYQAFCSFICQSLEKIKTFVKIVPSILKTMTDFLAQIHQDKPYFLQKIPSSSQISTQKKSFWLKKPVFNEELSQKLENLLFQKKINEFLEIVKAAPELLEIKSTVFSLLFEILSEMGNVTIAFEAMKVLILGNFTHLNKKIIKTFFSICLKARQTNLAIYLFQFFENQIKVIEENASENINNNSIDLSTENYYNSTTNNETVAEEKNISVSFSPISQVSKEARSREYIDKINRNSNHTSVFFLMNHYFILNIEKLGEIDMAMKQLEQFLSNITCNNENIRMVHKIFEELLKGCIQKTGIPLDYPFQLLSFIKLIAIKPNDIFFNKLIDFASKNDFIDLAELLFQNMVSLGIKPTIVTFNTLIYSYFKHNVPGKAWTLFEQLKLSNTKPDNFTYTTMINGIKNAHGFDLKLAFQLFEEYKQINKPDQIIYNCLLDACINSRNFEKAREILAEIKRECPDNQCDEITYNTLIKGCCKSKQLTEAIGFFEEMKAGKIKPNRITYNSLIDTCVKTNKMNIAWKFYDEMLRSEIIPDNFTYSILINGIKSNNTNKEELIKTINLLEKLEKMGDQFQPDEILYNSLIDACVKFNEINKALCLFEEMKKKNIEPSSITYGILIKAFGKMNDLVKAFKIFEQIKMNNLKINDVTYGCLLDACVKNNRIDLALVLFDKIKQDNITLNTILYTTLIKGFSKANKLEEAMQIFQIMKQNPQSYPNVITYNCILDACVKSRAYDQALSLFQEMKGILTPDLITYSTLIKGFSKMGQLKVASDLFYSMIERNILPDDPLVNMMLEACFLGKNSDMGLRIYEKLSQLNVKMSSISYGIIIKLYGQAKKFNQAMNMLQVMKQKNLKPGVIIYTNLLQICFNMRKVDRAVILFEKMQQEEVQMDHVCFTKLINGSLNCGKVELAYSFYEKSMGEKISLNVHVYKALIEELKASKIPEKTLMIENLEKTIKNSGLFEDNSRNTYNNNSHLQEKENHYEARTEERKYNNNKISFEINDQQNNENPKQNRFSKGKPFEERKNYYNKENKDNFNFRSRPTGENKEKTQDPPMFIGLGKKTSAPFISQKELCSMVMVNPKNL